VAVPVALIAALLSACAPRATASAAAAGDTSPRPSLGCTADAAPAPLAPLVVAGVRRDVVARVPLGAATAPRDVVIAFHGRTNDADQVQRYFGLDEALPEAIIVYPRALRSGPRTFAWSDPGDPPERLRDFALVESIVEAYGRAYCIDLDRVFVVGHSLGASFANDVACRLGDTIRAVASVAGGVHGGPCAPGTAALVVHHPDDRLVPLAEGVRTRDAFRSSNGLGTAAPVPAAERALARLRCVRYGEPNGPSPVFWCPHDDATGPGGRYYPHTWPEGAAAAIAEFFAGLRRGAPLPQAARRP
jgi:polyhydroxybutyrate depolymerase